MSGQFGQLVGPGVPDPSHYGDDWQQWARDLGQLLQTAQVQTVTQASVEGLLTGAWTPAAVGDTIPGTISVAGSAQFTRLANIVQMSLLATATVSVGATGDLTISGLPYGVDAIAYGAISLDAVPYPIRVTATPGATAVVVHGLGGTPFDANMIVSGTVIAFMFTYLTGL